MEDNESSDFEEVEDWWGVERQGQRNSSDENNAHTSDNDDDDDIDGGEMMPVPMV